jgi:UrcA family protein
MCPLGRTGLNRRALRRYTSPGFCGPLHATAAPSSRRQTPPELSDRGSYGSILTQSWANSHATGHGGDQLTLQTAPFTAAVITMGRAVSHPFLGLLASSACALWISVSGSAPPQPSAIENHPTQLVVKYADLDLSKRGGVIELYQRIETAARVVCAPRFASVPTQPGLDVCLSDAITRAVVEINQPGLTHYFTARMQQQRSPDPPKPP